MNNLFLAIALLSFIAFVVGVIKPGLVRMSSRKRVVAIFGSSILIFFVLFGISQPSSPQRALVASATSLEATSTGKTSISPVAYTIVSSKNYNIKATGDKSLSSFSTQDLLSLPIDKRMAYRIVVPSTITVAQIKPTVYAIISKITTKNHDIDEISLLFYSSKSIVNGIYDIAEATWAPNGQWGSVTPQIATSNNRASYQTDIQVRPNLAQYLHEKNNPQTKNGLSVVTRMKIYKADWAAEQKSTNEAYKNNTNSISKNADLQGKLLKLYRNKILTQYNITNDELRRIFIEGNQNNWP